MTTLKIAKWVVGSYGECPYNSVTLWFSGCSIRCQGCFNKALWDMNSGQDMTISDLLEVIEQGVQQGCQALALVGGEPLDQADGLGELLSEVRRLYPDLIVVLFTGRDFESATAMCPNLSRMVDYLVDGPFIAELADDNLGYRGSSNQSVRQSKGDDFVQINWDNLLVFSPNGIIGPGHLVSDGESQECGRFLNSNTEIRSVCNV